MAYMDVPPVGQANGRTVVLFHGMNFGGFYFGGPIDEIACRGISSRSAGSDWLRAFVKNPIIPYNFHDMALNTQTLLPSLGITKTAIVGHSMGGMLAARFAASYPDMTERVVPYDPIGLTDTRWEQPWHSAEEAYKAPMARTPDQAWAGCVCEYRTLLSECMEGEYEQYVRILYAPAISSDWPRLAMDGAGDLPADYVS